MQHARAIFIAAMTTAAALSLPASAATIAAATTPVNIRSGPGPQYAVIGAIPTNGKAIITGCIQGSLWCSASYNDRQGWIYARYMTATLSGRSLAVAEMRNMPPVVYQAPPEVVGSAVPEPVVTDTLVPPQPGQPLVIAPPPPDVQSYVASHPVAPVYLNGEVVTGAELPDTVALAPVPGSDYEYAYGNRVPVLVEPSTRQVVYVYR